MAKDLKYFMRENKEEIVTVPAPDTFKDDEGNVIEMQIKVLSNERITKINQMYRKRSIATDKKGQPYLGPGNEVVFKTEKENGKASRHIIAEALVYPNLQDPELMKFYNCHDITEMPFKVFPTAEEYAHVNNAVLAVLGLGGSLPSEDDEQEIADAKN